LATVHILLATPQSNRALCHSGCRDDDPVIGFTLPFYRWLHNRRIDQLHRALGKLEHELAQDADKSRFADCRTALAEIEFAVRSLKVARSFEVNLHRLRIHPRMVQEMVEWGL
jgi:hypothetical protein